MKKFTLSCLFFLMPFSIFSANYDFRKVSWGMSKEEVKQSEQGLELKKESRSSLEFKTEFSGIKVSLHYSFRKNRLYLAGYGFKLDDKDMDKEQKKREAKSAAEKFSNILDEKYKHKVNAQIFKDQVGSMGRLLIKILEPKTAWISGRTLIFAGASGSHALIVYMPILKKLKKNRDKRPKRLKNLPHSIRNLFHKLNQAISNADINTVRSLYDSRSRKSVMVTLKIMKTTEGSIDHVFARLVKKFHQNPKPITIQKIKGLKIYIILPNGKTYPFPIILKKESGQLRIDVKSTFGGDTLM